jgi:hypothetical protein
MIKEKSTVVELRFVLVTGRPILLWETGWCCDGHTG